MHLDFLEIGSTQVTRYKSLTILQLLQLTAILNKKDINLDNAA